MNVWRASGQVVPRPFWRRGRRTLAGGALRHHHCIVQGMAPRGSAANKAKAAAKSKAAAGKAQATPTKRVPTTFLEVAEIGQETPPPQPRSARKRSELQIIEKMFADSRVGTSRLCTPPSCRAWTFTPGCSATRG